MSEPDVVPEVMPQGRREEWVGIGGNFKDSFDSLLIDKGISTFEAVEAVVFADPPEERLGRVSAAIQSATDSITAQQVRDGSQHPSQAAGSFVITNEETKDFLLVFMKERNSTSDEYARSRNAQLETANRLFETFGNPPLPGYTSQSRKELV